MNKELKKLILTSVILALYIRLLTVALFEFPVALGLMGPDHETRVAPTDGHQEAVVVGPSHIGNMCAVGHIAFELCILPLRKRINIFFFTSVTLTLEFTYICINLKALSRGKLKQDTTIRPFYLDGVSEKLDISQVISCC